MYRFQIMNILQLYFDTLRFLRPIQFFYRIKYKFFPLKQIPQVKTPLSANKLCLDFMYWQKESWNPVSGFVTLNKNVNFDFTVTWDVEAEMLWLYNLHYFDDLNSVNCEQKLHFHQQLISEWIKLNSNVNSIAWDPYPISLRLVNWTKFFFRYEGEIPQQWLVSFAQQALVLIKRREYHLFGNHLYANGKALIFAGVLIKGELGNTFLNKGLDIIDKENNEQFLADGGHFELSPMYHSMLLMDLLELIELAKKSEVESLYERLPAWQYIALKAAGWMLKMQHSDGRIAFFNDASLGIAPPNNVIKDYLKLLEMVPNIESNSPVFDMKDTGFYSVNLKDNGKLIFDAGNIGPEYQPGHAHADTLSIELSLFGQKVFVNSGTSLYGISTDREFQRSTRAHNTVTIDDLNSSQVWGGFRVAKRAKITKRKFLLNNGKIELFAEHNGYQKLGVAGLHNRKITVCNGFFSIDDSITELEHKNATFRIYLHPDVNVLSFDIDKVKLDVAGKQIIVTSKFGLIKVKDSFWYPEFGIKTPNKFIEISFTSSKLHTKIIWEQYEK